MHWCCDGLIFWCNGELNTLRAAVDYRDDTSGDTSNRHSSQVCRLVIRVFKVEIERHSLTGNLKVDEVISVVEVQSNRFVVLSDLSRAENNWNLKFVVFARHQDCAWNNWEVKIGFLFKIGLKRDSLGVLINNFKHLLDWGGL